MLPRAHIIDIDRIPLSAREHADFANIKLRLEVVQNVLTWKFLQIGLIGVLRDAWRSTSVFILDGSPDSTIRQVTVLEVLSAELSAIYKVNELNVELV